MRFPCNKYEVFYLFLYSGYIAFNVITHRSRYESCAAPTLTFLLASQITFLLILNTLVFLKAPDLPHWARKFFTRLMYFALMPGCLYPAIQGTHWQIVNMKESPECPAVIGSSLLIWSWIVFMFIAGALLGWISCLKLKNWWGIYQLRSRMRRLNNLAAEGDLNALNELLLGDREGLLPGDIERLETKDYARSFAGVLVGSQNQSCPICFEDYEEDDKVISLPQCEHTFHPECVRRWLSKTSLCPICRKGVRRDLCHVAPQSQDVVNLVN